MTGQERGHMERVSAGPPRPTRCAAVVALPEAVISAGAAAARRLGHAWTVARWPPTARRSTRRWPSAGRARMGWCTGRGTSSPGGRWRSSRSGAGAGGRVAGHVRSMTGMDCCAALLARTAPAADKCGRKPPRRRAARVGRLRTGRPRTWPTRTGGTCCAPLQTTVQSGGLGRELGMRGRRTGSGGWYYALQLPDPPPHHPCHHCAG